MAEQRRDIEPSQSKVNIQSCPLGNSSGTRDFKRGFLLRQDDSDSLGRERAAGVLVGIVASKDVSEICVSKRTNFESVCSIDGLYFDVALHGD